MNKTKIICRNKKIQPNLIYKTVKVHNGKQFFELKINYNMLKYRAGQFILTKKRPKHK